MNRCSINHYGNANQNQMRYHFTTVRMPKIKTNNKCNEDVEKMKPSRKASGKVKRCIAALEISLAALQNSTLHIYPRELKTYIHIKCCTEIFIEAIFITAQNENNTMSNW